MYLNQMASWNPVVVPAVLNEFGDIQNSVASKEIRVRRQPHVQEVRTKDGAVHYSNYIYYVNDNVSIDDMLDGYLVVNVYDMITLTGKKRLRRCITI